jgi:hypothetical protein
LEGKNINKGKLYSNLFAYQNVLPNHTYRTAHPSIPHAFLFTKLFIPSFLLG